MSMRHRIRLIRPHMTVGVQDTPPYECRTRVWTHECKGQGYVPI